MQVQSNHVIDGDFGLDNADAADTSSPPEDRLTEALALLQEIRWRMAEGVCNCPACERWRQLVLRIDRVLEGT